MTSQYILNDVLESIKNMTVNYSFALNEASSKNIYEEYFDQFKEISQLAKDLFNLAYANNWYQLEEAPNSKIMAEVTKFKNSTNC